MTFEHEGKTYVRVDGTQCDECAFGTISGCLAPVGIAKCWENDTSYIWKEASDG